MTQTISPPTTVSAPARPAKRTLLAVATAAGPLFLGAGLLQGLTRDGFDFTRNALSQLSLGDLGWIQITAFMLTGALVIAGAVGMRQVLRDAPGGTWAPRLIGVFGVSFLLAGAFTADPAAGFPAGTPEDHVVWIEESASARARLEIADRYSTGGVGMWRLGQDDPALWPILHEWRSAGR